MPEDRPPERIAQYRLLELVGRGGMGDIYTARDERLGRIVALKTIRSESLKDPQARRRLLEEARAAAALSHPFICTIHEAIDVEGTPVIVMEYVPGETVASRVRTGPMPHRDVCRLAGEVAEALAAAHARGIVHRDISASNVMITRDGHVKVMDFGLAHGPATPGPDDGETSTSLNVTRGLVAGTPAYLAPEVLRGQQAAAPSDLYSFGVVLYLMATGRLPFEEASTTAELMAEILTRTPVAPRLIVPALPFAVEQIILRLLEKDPARRFASADDVREALTDAAGAQGASQGVRSIAVLPFKAIGQGIDPDLGVALADATITDLSAIRSLLVRPTSAILKYRDADVDPLRAGRELSAEAVVSGSLQRSGSRLRVSVQVHATADGRAIWATKIDSSLDDVFRMQDDVSREIVRSLEVRLTGSDERLMDAATRSESASQTHHVRGRLRMMHESVESLEAAIQEFQRAIDLDPAFAKSYAGMAAAYARMGFSFRPDDDYYVRAETMLNQALALDPNLPEARYIRGWLAWTPRAGFQHETAIRELNAAKRMAPGLYEAYDLLAIVLLHVSLFEESAHEFEHALDINPQDVYAYMHYGLNKYYSGEWSAAMEMSQEAWRRMPTAWAGYQFALTQVQLGLLAEAERTADAAERHFPNDVLFHPLRGLIAALRGDDRAAAREIELTIAHHRAFGHYHHAQYDVACIHALCGRPADAMAWLTDAARNGFPCHDFFARDRLIRPLHDLPAFSTLLDELTQESERCRRAYRETSP